jgi:hypothetical protein
MKDAIFRLKIPSTQMHAVGGHGGAEEWNPDLFYRLKLKLWNRDHMTNAVRTPWDRPPPPGADNAHWKMGTRVVITEEGDMHSGKTGRLVEYRGKGLYAVLMEDGHKVTFGPLQWERTADQRVRAPPPPLPVDAYRSAAHHALEAVEGRHSARDDSPAHYATPGSFGRGASYGNLSARVSKGGSGDVEMTPSAASQSNPPPGTRVRIIRTYGGQLLPKEEVRTGETHQFAHGWYYITLDDSGKKERWPCCCVLLHPARRLGRVCARPRQAQAAVLSPDVCVCVCRGW